MFWEPRWRPTGRQEGQSNKEQNGLFSNVEHRPRMHWKVDLDVFDLFDEAFVTSFVVVVVDLDYYYYYCCCRIGRYWRPRGCYRLGPCLRGLEIDHGPYHHHVGRQRLGELLPVPQLEEPPVQQQRLLRVWLHYRRLQATLHLLF